MQRELLFEGAQFHERHSIKINCYIETDIEQGEVRIQTELTCNSPEGEEKFTIEHQCKLSNPIDIIVIIGALAGTYAICCAVKFSTNMTKELYLAYSESKKELSKTARPSLSTRTRSLVAKFKSRSNQIKAEALKVGVDCFGVTVLV